MLNKNRYKYTTASCKFSNQELIDRVKASLGIKNEINSKAINHGNNYEDLALTQFISERNIDPFSTEKQKFIVHANKWVAATLDCLIKEAVIEVKCPFSRSIIDALNDKNYHNQVNVQMACAGVNKGYLVVYKDGQIKYKELFYDDQLFKKWLAKAKKFKDKYEAIADKEQWLKEQDGYIVQDQSLLTKARQLKRLIDEQNSYASQICQLKKELKDYAETTNFAKLNLDTITIYKKNISTLDRKKLSEVLNLENFQTKKAIWEIRGVK